MSEHVESPGLMEPLLPQESVRDLDDLVIDLIAKSSQLTAKINSIVAQSIGDLVRSMNCYYSNLIEGHNPLVAEYFEGEYPAGVSERINIMRKSQLNSAQDC